VALTIPNPPKLSQTFDDVVSKVDFALTDEHRNDNTQEVLVGLSAAVRVLWYYFDEFNKVSFKLEDEHDLGRRTLLRRHGFFYARAYDEKVDEFMYVVNTIIADLDRRLLEARFKRQVTRGIKKLPAGENPLPLAPNDPRVQEFIAQQRARQDLEGQR
jgi:hypothetical protein